MDLCATIKELTVERQRIDLSIQRLEQLLELGYVRHGRGRHSMPEAERQMVSNRMKEYWANRRRENRENKRAARKKPASDQVLVMAKTA